jgi:hypothetical protein
MFQVQDDKRQEVAAKEKLMKELDTLRADRTRLEDSIKVGDIPKYSIYERVKMFYISRILADQFIFQIRIFRNII